MYRRRVKIDCAVYAFLQLLISALRYKDGYLNTVNVYPAIVEIVSKKHDHR